MRTVETPVVAGETSVVVVETSVVAAETSVVAGHALLSDKSPRSASSHRPSVRARLKCAW
jgi:hypothetical protein